MELLSHFQQVENGSTSVCCVASANNVHLWTGTNYKNTQVIMHTGNYDGFVSSLVLLPQRNTGLVLLANSEQAAADLTEHVHEMLIDALAQQK